MSTFVYSRDMARILNAHEVAPTLPPHYERVAPGVDVLALVVTDESFLDDARFIVSPFNSAFYEEMQAQLINHRPLSKKWRYHDSHGSHGRKRLKLRQLPGSQQRFLH